MGLAEKNDSLPSGNEYVHLKADYLEAGISSDLIVVSTMGLPLREIFSQVLIFDKQ